MPSSPPKSRLLLGIVCGAGFVVLLGAISLKSSLGFATNEREVVGVRDAISLINQAQSIVTDANDLERRIVLGQRAPIPFNLKERSEKFTRTIGQLDAKVFPIPGADQHVKRLSDLGLAKLKDTSTMLDSYAALGTLGALHDIRVGPGFELVAEMNQELEILRGDMVKRLEDVAAEDARRQKEVRYWLEAGLTLAALVAALACLVALRDANRRAEIEENLKGVLALQTAILDSVSSAVITTDLKGTVTTFNQMAENLLGYRASEVIGKASPSLFHEPEEVVAAAAALSKAVGRHIEPGFELFVWKARHGRPETEEWTFIRKDGARFKVSLTITAIRGANGEIFGYVGVCYDLTDQKKTQETLDKYVKEIEAANLLSQQQNRELKRTADELKESRDAAVAATRMKSEFLANMSHEIRTPMNGVIGMVHLLLNTPLSEKQQGYARTVQQSAESLLAILNDILDLSKMEAGKMTLENFPFDLRLMLEDLCDVIAPSAHEKKLELNCVFPPIAPSRVIGDPGRLRQVLTNLLGNAIKFTERGEVSVSVRVLKENQKRVTYRFSVVDTGIGIGPERQERIFDSFTQADGSTTRKFGGTGLGLTISRQLAELMGGEIGVNSNVGVGSEFWLEMAFQKQPAAVIEPERVSQDLAGIRVLIADDNATNRYILREMLDAWNCRLEEATNGTEALSAISLSGNDPFACVIMDMHMPGMDGLETARAIKRDARHRDLPLILLSSSGFVPADIESATLYSAVLSKPVRTSPLYNAIMHVTGASSHQDPGISEIHAGPSELLKGVRVLVVEDNAVNQMVVTELLHSWGCEVFAVGNGLAAVEATAKESFDAILMDVQMPVMDGFEATAAIRAREEVTRNHSEIIAMTANAMSGDKERCLRAGMDSYLSKPLQPAALLEKLATAVGREVVGAEKSVPAAVPRGVSFDVERLDESCTGLTSLKLKVIDKYLVTSLDSLAHIVQAVAEGDANAAKSAAHGLKGSSLTIGSSYVGNICQELELLAGGERFETEAFGLVDALRTELLAVNADLKAYAEQLKQTQP